MRFSSLFITKFTCRNKYIYVLVDSQEQTRSNLMIYPGFTYTTHVTFQWVCQVCIFDFLMLRLSALTSVRHIDCSSVQRHTKDSSLIQAVQVEETMLTSKLSFTSEPGNLSIVAKQGGRTISYLIRRLITAPV